jgi:hypothetical protein
MRVLQVSKGSCNSLLLSEYYYSHQSFFLKSLSNLFKKDMSSKKPLESTPSKGKAGGGSGGWGKNEGQPFGYETFLVHGGVDPDPLTGAILTPIYQATTFVQVTHITVICMHSNARHWISRGTLDA